MTDLSGYQRRTSLLVIVSSITTAISLFAIFRITAELASIKWIGVWSLVQGFFLIARVGDSGAGNNISRVLAVRAKAGQSLDLRNLAVASVAIASLPTILIALISAPLVGLYIGGHFGDQLDRQGLWTMVWVGLLCAATAALSNVLMAIPEGAFELNYKSWTIISGNLVGVMAIAPLIKFAGPPGIAWAALASSLTQLLLAGIRVQRLSLLEPPVRFGQVRRQVQMLWRENLQLSGVALIRLSFEPATKFLLSIFAPLALIAQFELALRFTNQIRVVVQSGLQPLLVVGARSREFGSQGVLQIFAKNDRALGPLALGGLIAQILAAPALQLVGLDSRNLEFTVFVAILAAGNAINIMGLAGYYWQLTSGEMLPLVRVQTIMAVMNILFGSVAVALGSSTLVVAAYSAAFAFGGLVSRSFLDEVPFWVQMRSVALVAFFAVGMTGVVVAIHPASVGVVSLLLVCAAIVGAGSIYFAYRAFRGPKPDLR